jgi:hypothetical protein
MSKRSVMTLASAVLVASAALAAAAPAGATPPNDISPTGSSLTDVRITRQFDRLAGQLPENVALLPDGAADVTFAGAHQVARITPRGATRILATLPAPADDGVDTPVMGFALTTGIVRVTDGTVYVLYATGTADLTGVWRLRAGRAPRRIAALPADGLPNGLAVDERGEHLYITDAPPPPGPPPPNSPRPVFSEPTARRCTTVRCG